MICLILLDLSSLLYIVLELLLSGSFSVCPCYSNECSVSDQKKVN